MILDGRGSKLPPEFIARSEIPALLLTRVSVYFPFSAVLSFKQESLSQIRLLHSACAIDTGVNESPDSNDSDKNVPC